MLAVEKRIMKKRKVSPKEAIEAASATYRKATQAVADSIGIEAEHSKWPSEDFEQIIESLEGNTQKLALKFYRLGLRRGLIKATDWVVDGPLNYKAGTLYAPNELEVKIRVRLPNNVWKKKRFKFKHKELGFSD